MNTFQGQRGGGGRTRFYRQDFGHANTQNPQAAGTPVNRQWSLLQFLPLIIIFLSSFVLNFSREEAVYSLNKQYNYPTERETQNLRIKYYVDSNFQSNYANKQSKVNQIDNEIELNYVYKVQQNCEVQKNQKRRLEMQAQYYTGIEKTNILNKAKQVDLGPCNLVQSIKTQYPNLVTYYY